MDKKNAKKPNIQKAILKILAEKSVISVIELNKKIHLSPTPLLIKERGEGVRSNYALTRSIKNLVDSGLVEIYNSDNQKYLKLTKKGKSKFNCLKIEGEEALVSTAWDGLWRMVILDLPEKRKKEREALRYLLKKAGFVCVKNTVWISPYPYENLFTNIKKDLGLGIELMVLVTDKIDPETNLAFLELMKK
jgi:DNA-binding transcriptional regulator PaaX